MKVYKFVIALTLTLLALTHAVSTSHANPYVRFGKFVFKNIGRAKAVYEAYDMVKSIFGKGSPVDMRKNLKKSSIISIKCQLQTMN